MGDGRESWLVKKGMVKEVWRVLGGGAEGGTGPKEGKQTEQGPRESSAAKQRQPQTNASTRPAQHGSPGKVEGGVRGSACDPHPFHGPAPSSHEAPPLTPPLSRSPLRPSSSSLPQGPEAKASQPLPSGVTGRPSVARFPRVRGGRRVRAARGATPCPGTCAPRSFSAASSP